LSSSHDENAVNPWWAHVPGERYWLDVTDRQGRDECLATPRGTGRRGESWTTRLITHVRDGDVVFHYDAVQQAIAAWSVSHGRVEKRQVSWAAPGTRANSDIQTVPGWSIGLRDSTRLDEPVTLYDIARVQWDLFPTLRALEDEAGATLHYPFEMGDRHSTRPIAGYVFKLPAVFVQSFPGLARAAGHVNRLQPGRQRALEPAGALAVHPLAHSR
jgi:hypothetical protein